MSNRNACGIIIFSWVVMPSLAILLGAGPAMAQTSSATYTFLVGAGFLCDSADSSPCPAVVKSLNDDSYEMSGAGTLTTPNKSVTAARTFTHKSNDGVVLETGVWVASELVSFDLYGIVPGALMREGRALGPPQFGHAPLGSGGRGMFSGSTPAGGLAVLRIRILPVLVFARNATLQVNCALGKVPSERAMEGIRLALEGGGGEFEEEVSGRSLFLLTRPGAAAAAKAPTPEAETDPAPTEVTQ
jgi:hypothetical protein